MSGDVVGSVSLGWLLAAALLLVVLGLVIGLGWSAWRQRTRRLERQRLLARHALDLLNALPEPALLAGDSGGVLFQNELATRLLQEFNPPGELPGPVVLAVGRSQRAGATEALEISANGPGSRRYQARVTPLSGGDENDRRALVIFLDGNRLARRTELSQRLAPSLAHELRTPLTAILGHLEILNSCEFNEESLWRRSLGFVSSESERLARLVEDMLYLARLERAPLDLKPFDLARVADEVIANLAHLAEVNQVVLSLQAPFGLPLAYADPDRIRQVLINLLDNAIKYAPGCSVTIQIARQGDRLAVQVQDSGPGVPAQDLAHIFEPFYRSEARPARPRGSGLGLAIVQSILEQHQAPIQASSEAGSGTRFSFSLPTESAKPLSG
jgi:signal transduction histidine kinase